MKKYLIYNKSTGRCLGNLTCMPENIQPHLDFYGVSGYLQSNKRAAYHYVDTSSGDIKDKVDNPSTISGKTITNIPSPSSVELIGDSILAVRVEDSEAVLDSDVPGKYLVRVKPEDPKYYDAQFEVDL